MNIQLTFKITTLAPDQRQFKTSGLVVEPADALFVVVDVPYNETYFVNPNAVKDAENKQVQDLGFDVETTPLQLSKNKLTPAGLAYVEDQLLNRVPNQASSNKQSYNKANSGDTHDDMPTLDSLEWN